MGNLGVSFYPGRGIDIRKALYAATSNGIDTFFTSMHIPELKTHTMTNAITLAAEMLGTGAGMTHSKGTQLIADVSQPLFHTLGASPKNLRIFAEMGLTGLRLDYGFGWNEIREMADNDQGLKIVLNASTVSLSALQDTKLPSQQVSFWHNFYPRPETGLSLPWCLLRSLELYRLVFSVGAFLPYLNQPRTPLYQGLPTIERHRNIAPLQGAAELMCQGTIDTLVLADMCYDTALLALLKRAIVDRVMVLRIVKLTNCTIETNIALGQTHTTRVDPADLVLRSATSRAMATTGQIITPRNCGERKAFTVTLDNSKYGRYSGELQITLVDLPSDEKVNVLGYVIPEDQPLVQRIKPGEKFELLEAENFH